jgi:hypothetical protein
VYLPIHIYLRIKHGKVVKRTTYSYKSVLYNFLKYLPVVWVIVCLVYLLSKDIEITATLSILIFSCYIIGHLKMLLLEYQRKRAGGKEKLWEK